MYAYLHGPDTVPPTKPILLADLVVSTSFMLDEDTTPVQAMRHYETERDIVNDVRGVWDPNDAEITIAAYDYQDPNDPNYAGDIWFTLPGSDVSGQAKSVPPRFW